MDFAGYMRIEGENQGAIEGSSLRRGRRGLVNIHGFKHGVNQFSQSRNNLNNGPVVHQPVAISKEVDKSTPHLYQALVTKENLTIDLEWFRFDTRGEEQLYYKIHVVGAYITQLEQWMPEVKSVEVEHQRLMETVSIFYDEISWHWGPDGDTAFTTTWRGEA